MEVISFGEPARPETPEEIRAWIASRPAGDGPLCLWMDETAVSLAAEDGSLAVITLGGDLLTPGPDPAEVLQVLGEEIRNLLKEIGRPEANLSRSLKLLCQLARN